MTAFLGSLVVGASALHRTRRGARYNHALGPHTWKHRNNIAVRKRCGGTVTHGTARRHQHSSAMGCDAGTTTCRSGGYPTSPPHSSLVLRGVRFCCSSRLERDRNLRACGLSISKMLAAISQYGTLTRLGYYAVSIVVVQECFPLPRLWVGSRAFAPEESACR